MTRGLRIAALLLMAMLAPEYARADDAPIRIGSKSFTESVILGEILTGLVQHAGRAAEHRKQLGGTRILWNALVRGEIDLYPDYTGTIMREILAQEKIDKPSDLHKALASHGVSMTWPLGFNNTYAIGVMPAVANRYRLATLSDLARHPELRLGFSNEFMDRGDGWPALKRAYGFTHGNVQGLDHDLAYRGLTAGSIDAIDVYTTDAQIAHYGLRLLEDDRGHFPAYDAVVLYRTALANSAQEAVAAIRRLEGKINEARMSTLNAAVTIGKQTEAAVAIRFLSAEFAIDRQTREETGWTRFWRRSWEHLVLVGVSLGAAIMVAIPLGVVAARRQKAGRVILGAVAIVQTVPGLALLVFMIPLLGIGSAPAIAALFLYSLLPIVRNTHSGLVNIPASLTESAFALGLPDRARLRLVELPLAAPSILTGIKTSAVINVGTATLGALIGAGGYGQPILTGIRLDDIGLILEGAVPAALLALVVQGLFEFAERRLVRPELRAVATD